MAHPPDNQVAKTYALIDYEDSYVQPLILSALKKQMPLSSYQLISSQSELPSPDASFLQFLQYESLDFDRLLSHPSTSLANAYVIRKALIRKHYLSTTIANWVTKYPNSVLKKHVKPSVEFEVDYAEFLDDALVEAWELKESWERGGEWWILKPGMSERGQGIRLFSSEEELTSIFEEWDPPSDDEEEDEDSSDAQAGPTEGSANGPIEGERKQDKEEGRGIITSQLRHFIAQPYIHPPLLLKPLSSASTGTATEDFGALRKFHVRTYVLAVGALKVYVYKPMLALFAARPYTPPSASTFSGNLDEAMRAHLTNTCLQNTNERDGSVALFWSLPDDIPPQPPAASNTSPIPVHASAQWKDDIFKQICATTSEVFEAAARSMSIHFQPLPNAFELFGLDFMVSVEEDGTLRAWLLEVNAFPDFRQTGDELKDLVEGLFEGVVNVAIAPFFGLESGGERGAMTRVLDIDLGRR